MQGTHDPEGGVQTGDHVEHGHPGSLRRAVRVAGDGHEPGHALHQQVVTGHGATTLGSEPRDAGVNQVRPALGDRSGVEPESFQATRLEVLHENVRGIHDLVGDLQISRVFEIQHHRMLVAVHGQEIGADAVSMGRYPLAGIVTAGPFDLDDRGAHVRQEHGAVRSRENAGEISNDHSAERAAGSLGEG